MSVQMWQREWLTKEVLSIKVHKEGSMFICKRRKKNKNKRGFGDPMNGLAEKVEGREEKKPDQRCDGTELGPWNQGQKFETLA